METRKNAIIVHGMPSQDEYYDPQFPAGSNYHWLPWLQRQLIIRDIKADNPEMPHSYDPQWKIWSREFERFDINEQTILVGHSCGAGFLVRWLSEHPQIRVDKVVLVAPYLSPEGHVTNGFFDFEIDTHLVKRVSRGVTVFNSTNDDDYIHESIKILKENIENLKIVDFKDLGHFLVEDMESEEFPELLEEVLLWTSNILTLMRM